MFQALDRAGWHRFDNAGHFDRLLHLVHGGDGWCQRLGVRVDGRRLAKVLLTLARVQCGVARASDTLGDVQANSVDLQAIQGLVDVLTSWVRQSAIARHEPDVFYGFTRH